MRESEEKAHTQRRGVGVAGGGLLHLMSSFGPGTDVHAFPCKYENSSCKYVFSG